MISICRAYKLAQSRWIRSYQFPKRTLLLVVTPYVRHIFLTYISVVVLISRALFPCFVIRPLFPYILYCFIPPFVSLSAYLLYYIFALPGWKRCSPITLFCSWKISFMSAYAEMRPNRCKFYSGYGKGEEIFGMA